jgi:nucleoside-diphosphate-sugar epimerase
MSANESQVVFGTGPLGTAVARELLARGQRVRLVNRSGRGDVPAGAELVKGDATDPASARQVCQGAGVVFHCASPAYTEWPEKFPPITNGIIEGAADAGAKLVYGDNLYMYGPASGPLTEDLPNRAAGPKGLTRALMAEKLLAAHQSGKVRAAIGRASNFYGPGVRDSVVGEGVFGAALAGKSAEALGDLDAPHTYTFINDFAKGLVTLGEREEALGQVWHVPSAETLTTRRFVEMVFEEAGTRPKFRVASRMIVTIFGWFKPMMRELKEVLYEFEGPFVVDHGKYERAFGNHATPHREAIRQTLDWFRQQTK